MTEWGPAPVDGVPTEIEGVYLARDAFGDARPAELMAMLKGAMEEFLAEFGDEGREAPWLVTGELTYVKGKLFAGFVTVSTYSWAGWIGEYPGEGIGAKYAAVESLEEL